MNSEKFFDNYFKLLSLIFWPIIWYKWVAISNLSIEISLCLIYFILSIIYVLSFLYFFLKKSHNYTKIVIYYRVSTILAFIFTLFSFLLYPKNLTFLFLKLLFISVYFYFSCIKVAKYKIDEGVVGIIGSILIAVITIFY